MKNILLSSLLLAGSLGIMLTSCSQKPKHVDLGELKTLKDSASYIIGYSQGRGMAEQFDAQKVDLDKEIIARTFYQSLMGDTIGFTSEKMQDVMSRWQADMRAKQMEEAKKTAKPNREKAEKFLANNKTKSGVMTTESGLQYKIEKEGKNHIHPRKDGRVRFTFVMKDVDGKILAERSNKEDAVLTTPMNFDIIGLQEGLLLMTEGSKYIFWLHPDLAFGDNSSDMIPAGSMLCCEVELLEVIEK